MKRPIHTQVSKTSAPTAIPYEAIISITSAGRTVPGTHASLRFWSLLSTIPFGSFQASVIRPCSHSTSALSVGPGSRPITIICFSRRFPSVLFSRLCLRGFCPTACAFLEADSGSATNRIRTVRTAGTCGRRHTGHSAPSPERDEQRSSARLIIRRRRFLSDPVRLRRRRLGFLARLL